MLKSDPAILAGFVPIRPRTGSIRAINPDPTVRMLALSFLLLIGMVLVAKGFDQARRPKTDPVQLHKPFTPQNEGQAGTATATGRSALTPRDPSAPVGLDLRPTRRAFSG